MRRWLLGFVAFGVFFVLTSAVHAQSGDISLYGGRDHSVFLGCFSCSKYDSDSVFNEFSPYGNEFGPNSIYNDFSEYGSEFSDYSVCNEFAQHPPVLVDKDGGLYGYLTLNTYHLNAVTDSKIVLWLQTSVCGGD